MKEMRISAGADAGHLIEKMLELAGVAEAGEMAVVVQPEADLAVFELLRDAGINNNWVVGLTVEGGATLDVAVSRFDWTGVHGRVFVDDEAQGDVRTWRWHELDQVHIY